MKKMFSGMVLSLVLMTGCVATNVKETVTRSTARTDKMVQLIEQGKTTREQEQEFIRASRAHWHSLGYYLNDEPLPPDLLWLREKDGEE